MVSLSDGVYCAVRTDRVSFSTFVGTLLNPIIEGKIEEGTEVTGRQENVFRYWMSFRKREDRGNRKKKHQIALWRSGFGRGYGPVSGQTT